MSLHDKRKIAELKAAKNVVETDAEFLGVYASKLKENQDEDKMTQLKRIRDKKLKKKQLVKRKVKKAEDQSDHSDEGDFGNSGAESDQSD
jgi:hypothetical protein